MIWAVRKLEALMYTQKKFRKVNKIITPLLSLLLVFNSLSPFFVRPAFAQETPLDTPTTESIEPTSPSPSPTPEPTTTPKPIPTLEIPPTLEDPQTPSEESSLLSQSSTSSDSADLSNSDPDFSTPENQQSASLSTDKEDYTPHENVAIFGSDYLHNTTYKLVISSSDEPAVRLETEITSDEFGQIFYSYQLDGNYRPNYLIEIFLGSELIKSTTFTDNPSSGDSPSGNDFSIDFIAAEPSTYNHSTGGGEYDSRNIGVNVVESLNGGDFIVGDKVTFFDAISVDGSFDTGPATLHVVNKFGNETTNNKPAGFDSLHQVIINPTPPETGHLSLSGNESVSLISSSIVGDDLVVEFDVTGLEPGERLIVRLDVILYNNVVSGGGNVPSTFGGATVDSCTGNCSVSGSQTITLQNAEQINPMGDIIIRKVTDPSTDTSTQFFFTGDLGGFSLTSNNSQSSFSDLNPGTYSVSESTITNWNLTSISCTGDLDGGSRVDLSNRQISIDLDDGESIVCTFTNTQNRGSVTIIKDEVPDLDTDFRFLVSGPDFYSANFSLSDDGIDNGSNDVTLTNLLPGDYTIDEVNSTFPYTTSISCTNQTSDTDNDITFELTTGENVTCTFTNTLTQGSISGTKWQDMNANGIRDPEDGIVAGWPIKLDKDADGSIDVQTTTDQNGNYIFSGLLPGRYKVSESTPEPWNVSYPSIGVSYYDISLAAGNDLTGYDFGNYINARIEGIKWEDIDADGIKDPDETGPSIQFQIKLWQDDNGTPVDTGRTAYSQPNSGTFSFGVKPGTYYLSEVVPSGWAQTYPDSNSSILAPDGVTRLIGPITVTSGDLSNTSEFGNVRQGTIRIEKTTVPGDSDVEFEFYASYEDESFYLTDGQHHDSGYLNPGYYGISENTPTGWVLSDATCTDGEVTFDPRDGRFELTSDQNLVCSFTNTQYSSILGYKYEDMDGNVDTQDYQPVFGWDIDLYQCLTGGADCSYFTSTTTDTNGFYSFNNLLAGFYKIVEGARSEWSNLSNASIDLTLESGQESIDNNFVNTQTGSIQGRKYNDVNGNGDFDQEERDDTTNRLNGWTINLYDSSWQYLRSKVTGHTGNLGQYRFDDLLPGNYYVCETPQTNWIQTEPSSGPQDQSGSYCHPITVSPGLVITGVRFGNFQLAEISGKKFNDLNGDHIRTNTTTDPNLPNWTIRLDMVDSKDAPNCPSGTENGEYCETITNQFGNYSFSGLYPGGYIVSEVLQPDWTQTRPNSSYGGQGAQANGTYLLTVSSGITINNRNFGNVQLGSIHGIKFHDLNGNGERDCLDNPILDELPRYGEDRLQSCELEPVLAGWTIFLDTNRNGQLDDGESSTQTADEESGHVGWYWFENLLPGEYSVCEVVQEGWTQTTVPQCHLVTLPQGNSLSLQMVENAVIGPSYDFGNYSAPVLEITKDNDRKGQVLGVGDIVTYTIQVTNTGQSKALDVQVEDVQPVQDYFDYLEDSGTLKLEPDGTPISVIATGTNPYFWQIGDIEPGETYTLTYQIEITSTAIEGTHYNIALAQGKGGDGQDIFSDPVLDPFEVDQTVGIGGAVKAGDVLGASTFGEVLGASTGSPTLYLIIAFILMSIGLITKLLARRLLQVLLIVGLIISLKPAQIIANGDSIAPIVAIVELPEYKNTDNFEISYTALDSGGSGLKDVTLEYHKEGDGWQYLTTLTTPAAKYNLTSSQINSETKYYFRATACDNSGNCTSDETNTIVDRTAPPAPNSFSKEKTGSQSYKLRWYNPYSDQSYRIYIYRSENQEFNADSGTMIADVAVTVDTETQWDNSVPNPDKTYYYVIRAVDSANNYSNLVGDIPTTPVAPEGQNVDQNTGAISGWQNITYETTGSILGDQDNQESSESEPSLIQEDDTSSISKDQSSLGQVLGSQDGFLKRYWWLLLILFSGGTLFYLTLFRKKK